MVDERHETRRRQLDINLVSDEVIQMDILVSGVDIKLLRNLMVESW